jgi:hypothetical protein
MIDDRISILENAKLAEQEKAYNQKIISENEKSIQDLTIEGLDDTAQQKLFDTVRENINNQNQFNNQEYNQTNSPQNITLTQNFNIQGKQSADEILRIAKKQSTEAVANAFKNYIR